MLWDLHGVTVGATSFDPAIEAAWHETFASVAAAADGPVTVGYGWERVAAVPAAPERAPDYAEGDFLRYYVDGDVAIARFPRFGSVAIDMAAGRSHGQITEDALTSHGVFEDLIAIGLSPHLRRRGLFLIHAFAAALDGRGVLLVGGIGAGKTTTGMSLLDAGWGLISNDSPIIDSDGSILSYPGPLSAYPETFARFASTANLARRPAAARGRAKISVAAESIWSDTVWVQRADPAAIFFPIVEDRDGHAVEPLSRPEALRQLLPHAVEQWDKAMIPKHLKVLGRLVERAPAHRLRLGPDVQAIPAAIMDALR